MPAILIVILRSQYLFAGPASTNYHIVVARAFMGGSSDVGAALQDATNFMSVTARLEEARRLESDIAQNSRTPFAMIQSAEEAVTVVSVVVAVVVVIVVVVVAVTVPVPVPVVVAVVVLVVVAVPVMIQPLGVVSVVVAVTVPVPVALAEQ
jgi:hypothetical protein